MNQELKPTSRFKKFIKAKLFWVAVVLVVGGTAYAVLKPAPKPEYTTTKVKRQNLKQTVSVTGSVQGASEIDLNFETVGIIAKINVSKGQSVKAGEELAQLSSVNQRNAVLEARANLQAAQATLRKMIAGGSPEDIAVSEETVNNAAITYDNKVRELANLKLKLAADEQSYYDKVDDQKVEVANARDSALNTLSNKLFDAEAALNRIKDILEDDDAKNTLGAKNAITKINTISSRDLGLTMVQEARGLLTTARLSLADEDIQSALARAIDALIQVNQALADAYEMLIETPAGTIYTQAEIDADKTNIESDQAAVSASITSIQNSKTSWDTAKAALKTAENNLAAFLANKESQVSAAQGAVTSAKGAWDLALARLDLMKSPARAEDIALQRAKVSQAQAALSRARAVLDQMTIYAPVDGLITKINYEIGEKTNLTKPVISLLGESGLEIEVDIPESDISKIAVGQEVSITLDAFSDEDVFVGHVTFIDPAETVISDVVYYKVKVLFDQAREDIKPGMSANIDIITASKDNVLVIPVRAVKTNGAKYVQVLDSGQVIKKDVTTGLRGDGGLIEIISGLKEGEEVITFIKEAN